MTKFSNHNRRVGTKAQTGFIKMIIIILGALVLLKYVYDIDVIGFLTQGRFRELLDQFYNLGDQGWGKYSELVTKLWNYAVEFIKNLIAKIK
jgi:hypothetical protein